MTSQFHFNILVVPLLGLTMMTINGNLTKTRWMKICHLQEQLLLCTKDLLQGNLLPSPSFSNVEPFITYEKWCCSSNWEPFLILLISITLHQLKVFEHFLPLASTIRVCILMHTLIFSLSPPFLFLF